MWVSEKECVVSKGKERVFKYPFIHHHALPPPQKKPPPTSSMLPGVQLRGRRACRFKSSTTLGHPFSIGRVMRGSPSRVMGWWWCRCPSSPSPSPSSSLSGAGVVVVPLSMQRLISIRYS